MNLANQFSYLLFSLGGIVALVILLRYLRKSWLFTGAAVVGVAVLVTGLFFVIRPGLSDVDSVQAAETIINNGKPTMVEFFSNYCIGCMAVRPAVDQLVEDVQSRYNVNVLRVDIHTDFGRELRQRYGFSYSPEFILFDRAGVEVWRSNIPPSIEQIASVAGVTASTQSNP